MTTNTGGPVFPIVHPPVEGFTFGGVESYGLTIRDYFASKAIVSQPRFPRSLWQAIRWGFGLPYESSRFSEHDYAKRAYEMADAMLKARG